MNKILLSIVLTPIIVISLYLFAPHVEGGVIHHHVTVNNSTSDQAQITLWTYDGHTQQATVAPGAQYKFDTGVKCPQALSGDMNGYHINGQRIKISPGICTKDGSPSDYYKDCGLNCASSSFTLICQPRPAGVACYFVKD